MALGLTLEDALPAGLSYTGYSSSDDWSCSESGGSVSCTLPSLAAGADSSLDIRVDISSVTSHTLENSASVISAVSDADGSDNSATVSTDLTNAPTFDAPPTIDGSAAVGNTVTAAGTDTSDGDGDTITLSYQWFADGVAISGATGNSYTLTSGEAHKTVTVAVTASDGYGGSAEATSAAMPVTNTNPAFNATPSISGAAAMGNTLSIIDTTAVDTDGDNVTLSYEWRLDGVAISSATADTYTVQASDAGGDITAVITASDGYGGSVSAETAAVTVADTDASGNDSASGGGGAVGWFGLLLGLAGLSRRRELPRRHTGAR